MCRHAVANHPSADGIAVDADLGADVFHCPAMHDALLVKPLGIGSARASTVPHRNAVALGCTLDPLHGRIKLPRNVAERPSLFHIELAQFILGEPYAEFVPTVGTTRFCFRSWRVLGSWRVFGQ